MRYVNQTVRLIASTPNPLELIEYCGRKAWRSECRISPGTAAPFVKMLLAKGHTSVLEHASATLEFVTDIGIAREIMRHRHMTPEETDMYLDFAVTQESTRYCRYDGGIEVIEPLDLVPEQRVIWEAAAEFASDYYNTLLEMGCKPQTARDVLPLATKTELVLTANFREWLHILEIRSSRAAHPKVRELMQQARALLNGVCPEVFAAEAAAEV